MEKQAKDYIAPLAKLIPLVPLEKLPEPLLAVATSDEDFALRSWGTYSSRTVISGGGSWGEDG